MYIARYSAILVIYGSMIKRFDKIIDWQFLILILGCCYVEYKYVFINLL